MRKILCMLLCMAMVVSIAAPAFAQELDEPAVSAMSETGETTPPPTQAPHQHSWGEGSVTKEPTCTESGTRTYTCACGETKSESVGTLGHDFSPWSSADGSTHKRVCAKCGVEETGPHGIASNVTTPATCLATGVKTHSCSDCGYSYTEEIPVSTTHAWGAWQATVETHSRECADCKKTESSAHIFDGGEVTVPATCLEEGVWATLCTTCEHIVYEVLPKSDTHTYDNVCDPDCNVCGAKREAGHKFSTQWSKDYTGHWHACTKCGEKADIADHFPGPAATEEKAQLCLTCGYVMTAKLNHTHNFAAEWTSDETGHWYACDDCEDQKEFSEHTYEDGCDPDCNVCGFLTGNAHSYDDIWQIDETSHWRVCNVCGANEDVAAHIVASDAAETDAQVCIICEYEIAPAQEHVHEFGEGWATDEASHWQECECGEKAEAAQHTWDEGTENEDGTMTYLCTQCQAERTEAVPEKQSGFPWGIVLLILLLTCAAAVAALIFVLKPKKGKFTK